MRKKTSLKIAVCFFGHLRTFNKCAPFLCKNLLDKYDCDLFMHTWSTLDHTTKAWHNARKTNGETKEDKIIGAYGEFKGLKIEKQEPLDKGLIKAKHHDNSEIYTMAIFGYDAMFSSMRKSNALREEYAEKNKIKYDFVLFVRPDIWLKKPLNIGKVLEIYPKEKISRGFFTLSNPVVPAITGLESFGGTDILFFAEPTVMSDVIKNTEQCVNRFEPNTILAYCPEYELTKLVVERGWTPYYILDYKKERDWEIFRHARVKISNLIIKLHIRKKYLLLWLFPRMMRQIISLQLNLFGIYAFDIAIGNPGHEETKKGI
ncbi:MAG: hypothetical protein LBU73_09785 [Helicobacteraceae bacterium]|jgi:hypothetical protein|nr:hypothetical protein [Helicobacteraceae bacterium]